MRTTRPSKRSCSRAFVPPSAALLLSTLGPSAYGQTQQQPSPCFRWSGQMAIANSPGSSSGNSSSSLYYYGGQAMTSEDQTSNTWTNALVAIGLDQDWPTGTPDISLVQGDNGNYTYPPAVALGALWSSADGQTLYQYGGQFSDSPTVPPPAENVFAYDIPSNSWSIVQTSGDRVGRVAEGCPTIVPSQGTDGDNVGYYFSGHQDDHTTQGWSDEIARIYLNSMAKFDLGSTSWTNITSYSTDGSTSNTSTPITPLNRADGTLTYVPNLGTDNQGLLVSVGGATDSQYVDNSVLDVFDIGAGGWTKQSTLGDTIGTRVNHCAVRGTAKVHGVETHHIFIYGGQQLNQSDRDSAMYILTIQQNSYTWTFVGDELSGQPPGRAGHQCALSGNQLVVVGGLIAGDVLCEQPGIYVYNTSSSAWESEFQAGSTFSTPALVANVTGGIGTGSSTSGAGSATGGNGSSDPDTSGDTNSGSTSPSGTTGSSGRSKINIGAIVGGVVGGVVGLALLALLLLLLMRRRRRERAVEEAHQRKDKFGAGVKPGRSDSGSSRFAFPYEKHRPNDSRSTGYTGNAAYGAVSNRDSPGPNNEPASDDVEEETRNMEAAFNSSSLVPRRELRVVNADED
ncbi:hypothetical protein JCM1840_003301 [Sporobolomyces johnsonii]